MLNEAGTALREPLRGIDGRRWSMPAILRHVFSMSDGACTMKDTPSLFLRLWQFSLEGPEENQNSNSVQFVQMIIMLSAIW